MGTTIRREPVNFAIPNAPNYKFLNITNFRGLDVSSNPFELATNTASDCLNVYVDETNTLTTRPRLERKITHPMDGTHIGTYNLHNGYLLHYLVDGVGVMKTLIDGVLTDVTGKDLTPDVEDVANKQYYEIPSVKCEYFEQGDKTYLLDGERYMVIFENELSDIEGYIPTTAVVALDGTRQSAETINLLSDKFIEKYYWDGLSKLSIDDKNVVKIDNNYYTEKTLDTFIPLVAYDDYSAIGYYYGTNAIKYIEFDPKKERVETDLNLELVNTARKTVSAMTETKGFWYYINNVLYRCIYNNGQLTTTTYTASNTILSCNSNHNGTYARITVYGGIELLINFNMTAISMTYPDGQYSGRTLSNNRYYLAVNDSGKTKMTIYVASLSNNIVFSELSTTDYVGSVVLETTSEDELLVVQTEQNKITDPFIITTYTHLGAETEKTTTVTLPANVKISSNGVLYGVSHENFEPSKLFIVPDYLKPNEYYYFDKDAYFSPDSYNSSSYDMFYTNVFGGNYIIVSNRYLTEVKSKYFIFDSSKDALINVTRQITQAHPQYTDWSDKRKTLNNSFLNTRFDNNYWFASKNRYYRSQNNDPTYFPITEYNDLGDSNEEITGFNLANDTTLIAYKNNKVYLIQPFTSSLGTTEYTITESKNTVGNTAIGAPIVTTLTEIPLQINNDGIYGLSQLSNVSATERIADLMSEPINERWLNIDDGLIKNIKTLNRLYWTYVIIPNDKESCTQIYLLDNRSNSWYYWELPIVVMDAFAKDNITEFVDVRGDIYFLTTTDIIDKNYDDEKITKYYDEGERLIPWYWQSQVLYLGTMNYSKRLVNTTFILTDTDDSDGYGLQYNFKVFRKLASSTPEKEISDKLTLVRSTTKKTNISKFGFIQLRLSNLTKESRDYEAYENNKLRLVGLGLKYVLLEGLIR